MTDHQRYGLDDIVYKYNWTIIYFFAKNKLYPIPGRIKFMGPQTDI